MANNVNNNVVQQAAVVVIGDNANVFAPGCQSPPPRPNSNATTINDGVEVSNDGVDAGEEDVIKKVSEFIKNDYLNKYRMVRCNPTKPHMTRFQEIFVKRDLHHLDSEGEHGDFMYKIFESSDSAHSPSRVLIVGKSFTGKSILCQKYAYDWANPDFQSPEPFDQFKIVVWLKLCEVQGNLDEILEQEVFHSRLTEHEKSKFFSYMKKNPRDFLFLLDGVSECNLDELPDLKSFLFDKRFGDVYLIATVRPCTDGKLNEAFHSRYRIAGFSKSNIFDYVSRFFRYDTKKDEDLKECLESGVNSIFMELAENPLLTLVLCEMWNEESKLPTITRFCSRYTSVVLERFRRKFGEAEVLQDVLLSLENLASLCFSEEEKSQFSREELLKCKVNPKVGFLYFDLEHESFKFFHDKLKLYFMARWIDNRCNQERLEGHLKTIQSSYPAALILVAGLKAETKNHTLLLQFLVALTTKSMCENFFEDSCYCKTMDLFLACIAEAWTEKNSSAILELCKELKPFRKNKTPNGYPLKMSHGAAQGLGLIVRMLELSSLNLSGILIPLSEVKVIASKCLWKNNMLESVTFSHSCLCPDAVEVVCTAFSTMLRLEEVNLSCCNLGDKGLLAVAALVKNGQIVTLKLADHLEYKVEKEQIDHSKQPVRRVDSSIQIETLSRFQEECAISSPSEKTLETFIKAFTEDVENQDIEELSLPVSCVRTLINKWLDVFRQLSPQLKRIEIHLKELGKDLEDDLVQLVNNMPHLEKMSLVLEVEDYDLSDLSNHSSFRARTNNKIKLTIKDHTQSVTHPTNALR